MRRAKRASPRRIRMRQLVAGSLVTIGLVALLVVAVFPTRTLLDQHRELARAQKRVQLLEQENRLLASRVKRLHSDEEIERIAREQYNLVRPGEEAYALLPAPGEPTPKFGPVPAPPPKPSRQPLWRRALDVITFWN